MKLLQDLIRIISPYRDDRAAILDIKVSPKSRHKLTRLFYGIQSGAYSDDFAAAKDLYGSDPADIRYAVLKSRFQQRLLDSLFHLRFAASVPEFLRVNYETQKKLFKIQSLVILGGRGIAVKLARRTLEKAEYFSLTSIVLELYQILRSNASIGSSSREFEFYSEGVSRALRNLSAEVKSFEYWERVKLTQLTSTYTQVVPVEVVAGYLEELESLRANGADSFVFLMNYFRLNAFFTELTQNHEGTVQLCQRVENYYNEHPQFSVPVRRAEFAVKELDALLLLRNYEEGKLAADKCSALLEIGKPNWFVFIDKYFMLTMNTFHFEEAHAVLQTVMDHPRFSSLPNPIQERWKIYQLYVSYALNALADPATKLVRSRDSLGTIQTLAPTFVKDKHGLNISLHIIHILYLLETKDFGAIIDRMEALKTYRTRYLKPNSNPQSSLFFKLLRTMENNSFSYTRTQKKGEKYFSQLKSALIDPEEVNEGLQILPYDWLWQRVLDKLKEYEEAHAYA